jgi:hypothetical protein
MKIVGNIGSANMIRLESDLQRLNIRYWLEDSDEFYRKTKEPILYSPSVYTDDNQYIGYTVSGVKMWLDQHAI